MSTTDDEKVHAAAGEARNVATETSQQLTHVDDLKGKPVISITNGVRLGTVDDVAIDPDGRKIAALIMATGMVFQRDVVGIPADHVQVWGKDAILVRSSDVLYRGTNWPAERGHWVNALDRFKGTSVISTDGRRLGQVSNILLEPDGTLAGFTLGQGSMPNPLARGASAQAQFIESDVVKTFGRDVVIVDAELLAAKERAAAPAQPTGETTAPPQPQVGGTGNPTEPTTPSGTQV